MPDGWMSPSIVDISPTQAHGGSIEPVGAMNHIMQGYYRTMVSWSRERPYVTEKSAQFLIDREGAITQTASIFVQCWAGGRIALPTSSIIRKRRGNPNDYLVHIEHEGFSIDPISYPYDYLYSKNAPWPKAMVDSSIRVQIWILKEIERVQGRRIEPSKHTLMGHRAGDNRNRRHDPSSRPLLFGDGVWPQKYIIDRVRRELVEPESGWNEDGARLRKTLFRMLMQSWRNKHAISMKMADDNAAVRRIIERHNIG